MSSRYGQAQSSIVNPISYEKLADNDYVDASPVQQDTLKAYKNQYHRHHPLIFFSFQQLVMLPHVVRF
jgi:hypothetical protein